MDVETNGAVRVNREDFYELLCGVDANEHWVKPVILRIDENSFYFRLEANSGGFLIELLHNICTNDLMQLKKMFESINCKMGFVATVLPTQINLAFYSGPVKLPVEFME